MSEIKVNKISSENSGPIVAGNIIKCDVAARDDNDLVNLGYVRQTLGSGIGVSQTYVDGQDQFYATQAGRNFVYKNGNVNETVTGIKTFTATPKTSDSPDLGEDITNKAYVDLRDSSTLRSANQYTDSKIGGGALGFDSVEVDGWIGVDASGITEDNQLTPDWSQTLTFTGANGIIVRGSTGTQVRTDFETGLTYSETYNRLTIDGSGAKVPSWTSQTDLGIGSILIVRSATVNGGSDYSYAVGTNITGVIKYYGSGAPGRYVYNGSIGTPIQGTWRVVCWSSDDSGNPSSQFLAQRIS
jgi:hypothetical protein